MRVFKSQEGFIGVENADKVFILYEDGQNFCLSCAIGKKLAKKAIRHENWNEINLTYEIRARIEKLEDCKCLN